jgi:hypothetical protein
MYPEKGPVVTAKAEPKGPLRRRRRRMRKRRKRKKALDLGRHSQQPLEETKNVEKFSHFILPL